ncbi:hypothetical protein BDV28DRAFT_146269 [Aspergillus coremiiformis]|uniref:Uncharacterized protein n=1 Tax=Aspergillus coremiiformis TaxID=138285 RepID=A0A5N6ZCA3_9EURO|nr:hypothetical protein BDV28DRAFT_146269 [Aspergillus coremiiformis]
MASIASKSALFESPSVPRSSQQWKVALQKVKLLYIQRQYKQCAARAMELVENAREPLHPIYKTYLSFYSAVCYEEMGRAAHKYSSNKIRLLQCALDYFVTCGTILPCPIPVSSRPSQESSFPSLGGGSSPSEYSDSPSTVCGLVTSITDIIDRTIQWQDDDPFISDTDSCGYSDIGADCTVIDDNANYLLVPPPLRVRKSSGEFMTAVCDSAPTVACSERLARAHLPPPLPIKVVPLGATSAYKTETEIQLNHGDSQLCTDNLLIDLTERVTPATPQYADNVRRYNSSIRCLRSQIDSSIDSIHTLIDEVEEKQHAHKMSKTIKRSASFWSFSPVKDGETSEANKVKVPGRSPTKETKQQRIARLRAEGWETVGLRSAVRGWKGEEYYNAYCSSVLDELYLDPYEG